MTINVTLNNVTDLTQPTSSATTINNNSVNTINGFLQAVNASGDTMGGPLDMNGFQLLNLGAPMTQASALRLSDLNNFVGGGTVTNIPTGGTTGQVLGKRSNNNYDIQWTNSVTSVGLALPSDFTVTNTPVTTTGTLTGAWATTPTGTGAIVKATSPTLTGPNLSNPVIATSTPTAAATIGTIDGAHLSYGDGTVNHVCVSLDQTQTLTNKTLTSPTLNTPTINTPSLSGATTVTSTSANALTVGANGATNPVLDINASAASVATGLSIIGAAAGNGALLTTISSGTNENLGINAKGSGSISIGNTSTGSVLLGGSGGGVTVNGSNFGVTNGLTTLQSNSASALTVGASGGTNPTLQVNSSASSAATGVAIVAGSAGNGTALNCISSGTNEAIGLNAKGSGVVGLGTTSTGGVNIGSGGGGVRITGVTDGSNAAAGIVGEYVTAQQTTAQSLTTATPLNITSISLTAGDWDISGSALFLFAATTVCQNIIACISTTSATLGGLGQLNSFNFGSAGIVPNGGFTMNSPVVRVNVSSTTTVYLVVQSSFTTSTATVEGLIRARRVR